MSDIENILLRIQKNFPVTPVPVDVGCSSEGPQVNAYFNGRAWPTITINSLLTEGKDKNGWGDIGAYINFMTNEGFQYYLPAYMRMTLEEMDDENGWLMESIIYILHKDHHQYTLQKQDGTLVEEDNFPQKLATFTMDQKQVIADFLQHQIHHYGPNPVDYVRDDVVEAYNSYWYQFATQDLGA